MSTETSPVTMKEIREEFGRRGFTDAEVKRMDQKEIDVVAAEIRAAGGRS